MTTGSVVHLSVDGQRFTVREREPGVYDFDWDNGPEGRGFTSATSDRSPMDTALLEISIRSYLRGVDADD